jgi:lysine 6-dehydrogenase
LKITVIGAGLMGSAATKYLVARKEVKTVQLVDKDKNRLERTAKSAKSSKLVPRLLDASDRASISAAVENCDAALIALPHGASLSTDLAMIDAGVNAVDLVFEDVQMELHSKCLKAGMTLIPGCGVAPGLVQVLAGEGARQLTSVEEIHMFVGGLPQVPKPPLSYRIVFSFEQVLEMYANEVVRVIRDGKVKKTKALTELERVSFQKPYDDMEAFLTDGVATLLYTMKGRVKVMDEKTVRYPGHAEQIKTLIETGVVATKPVEVNGKKVIPRKLLSAILGPKLVLGKEKDVTLLRVTVCGTKEGSDVRCEYEMIDRYDEIENITSMARTTAFTGAIATMMLADHRIEEKGILAPESCFAGSNFKALFQRLAEKNVKISRTVTSRTPNIANPRRRT